MSSDGYTCPICDGQAMVYRPEELEPMPCCWCDNTGTVRGCWRCGKPIDVEPPLEPICDECYAIVTQ